MPQPTSMVVSGLISGGSFSALIAPLNITPVTVSSGSTLSGAGIVGGIITRTGPTAAFTDTTDTAINIINALPTNTLNQSWQLLVANLTNFQMTVAAGVGVTLSGLTPQIAANCIGIFQV